jgi:hypothetical protein
MEVGMAASSSSCSPMRRVYWGGREEEEGRGRRGGIGREFEGSEEGV